jgi:hypothetical protein
MPRTQGRRTHRSAFFKPIAKRYVAEVENIRVVLKQKRKEYKEAAAKEKKAKTPEELNALNEKKVKADAEFEEEKLKWPYYKKYRLGEVDGLDRVPYSPEADPFPGEAALHKLSMLERARIVGTAMLARRGVKDKKRFLEGFVPRINAADDIHQFKHYIKKYINPKPYSRPPSYPREGEPGDEDWEDFVYPDERQITPPINIPQRFHPTYRYRNPYAVTPEGSPGMVTQGNAPLYSSPDYSLETARGGRKTRKHKRSKTYKRSQNKRSQNKRSQNKRSQNKRSKHKRSQNKRSKHKRSQNKRKMYSKRNKTYKK